MSLKSFIFNCETISFEQFYKNMLMNSDHDISIDDIEFINLLSQSKK
jgi:hypothetical protein